MKIFELHDPFFLPHCGCELQFSLDLGNSIVLIGENGIGKSTLLHRLYSSVEMELRAVIEQKTSEYFFDRKLITLKRFFLEGDLPQFNIENFLSLWHDFELDKKEQRLISHLSGGELQALKLCLALCKECTFYFLDEPSQFLDTQRKKTLSLFLEKIRTNGKSLIIVEHNIDWMPSGWTINKLLIENNVLKRGAEWII